MNPYVIRRHKATSCLALTVREEGNNPYVTAIHEKERFVRRWWNWEIDGHEKIIFLQRRINDKW